MQTRTPKEINSPILQLCREINGNELTYIPVKSSKKSEVMECFHNVKNHIEKNGGKIQFGWAIWEWLNVLIEAEFHTVWISPDNKLLDVTPNIYNQSEILFLPDDSKGFKDIENHKRIDNIRRPLIDDKYIIEFIKVNEEIYEIDEKYTVGKKIIIPKGNESIRYSNLHRDKDSLRIYKSNKYK